MALTFFWQRAEMHRITALNSIAASPTDLAVGTDAAHVALMKEAEALEAMLRMVSEKGQECSCRESP